VFLPITPSLKVTFRKLLPPRPGGEGYRVSTPGSRATCLKCPPFTTSMGDILRDRGLSIRKLLRTLREQLAFTMFADSLPTLVTQTDVPPAGTPPDLTLEEVGG